MDFVWFLFFWPMTIGLVFVCGQSSVRPACFTTVTRKECVLLVVHCSTSSTLARVLILLVASTTICPSLLLAKLDSNKKARQATIVFAHDMNPVHHKSCLLLLKFLFLLLVGADQQQQGKTHKGRRIIFLFLC